MNTATDIERLNIQSRYRDLCAELGDLTLQRETIDLRVGAIRAEVARMKNRIAELDRESAVTAALAEQPAAEGLQ